MSRERSSRLAAWSLVAFLLLGEVLFGATALRFGPADEWPLIKTRAIFFGIGAALAAAVLLLLPRERRPGAGWSLIVLPFPAWIALQLLPLPVSLVSRIDPARARLLHETWPGPITGCEGETLLAAAPPSWTTLSVDSASTISFLVQVVAALLAFLAARGAFAHSRRERRSLLVVMAGFAGLEAAYGIAQWLAQTPQVLWMEKSSHIEAASGTLINRNHFALLVYLGLGCTLTLLADRLRRHRSDRVTSSREAGIRATLFAVAALQVAAVVASQSRAGLAVICLMALAGLPLLYRGSAVIKGLAAAMILMIAVPAGIVVGPDLFQRLSSIALEWTSEAGRGAVLRHGLEIVRDFPVFGTGGGSFQWVFSGYRGPAIHGRFVMAHDDYLQILVEAGAIGLVLALLPVARYAAEVVPAWWRDRRLGDAISRPWPLWLALAALALHELVDFGLQIPAHALLVGVLAGGASVRVGRAVGSRWFFVLSVSGLLLAPVAALHSVVEWPVMLGVLPWPDHPEARDEQHRALFKRWRAQQDDPALLCEALFHQSRSLEMRPLSAWAAASLSRISAILYLNRPVDTGGDGRELEEQALRAADLARRVDPWNSFVRRNLMEIGLSLGALDVVADDVRVVLRLSDSDAERVVGSLRRAGLPPPMIFQLVAHSPGAVGELLRELRVDGDWDTAGALIPADARADPVLCRISGEVSNVLREAHSVPIEPFLRSCLDLPEVSDDDAVEDRILVTLAAVLMREEKHEE
ncbi:MAG: O-antigen ligase family protein, partial [Acidobacteriota bacterium]|nr:O-antigen ligase family protein [Acidobacteriota bacterium]